MFTFLFILFAVYVVFCLFGPLTAILFAVAALYIKFN